MGKTNKLKGSFEPIVQSLIDSGNTNFGSDFQYETQTFKVTLDRTYTPDWVWNKEGVTYAIEAKGFLRVEDREKILAFTKQYPDVKFHLVLQKDNKIYAGSKYRYSDWCVKNSISYSVNYLPEGIFK